MLANLPVAYGYCGALDSDVHLSAASRYELLDFIANQLPRWRDDPERPENTSETALTDHLCDHLSSAARKSAGWDILQFRTEVPDEECNARKIDLVPKPCGAAICIEGRRHSQYDALLPIECKRLPTPKDKDRDEREYVFSGRATTGGIQRFKAGHHGAAHTVGAMIAYVQQENAAIWYERVRGWIGELVSSGQPGWSTGDLIQTERDAGPIGLAVFRSSHTRANGLVEIELRHLWVEMIRPRLN
jgi:hypothetical protein